MCRKLRETLVFSCNHRSCYVSCPRYYKYTDEILMHKFLAPDMETNECLINNGGCWQDVKANITACKVHVTLFLTNNTSGFIRQCCLSVSILYESYMVIKLLKKIYECSFHNHHAVFLSFIYGWTKPNLLHCDLTYNLS